VAAQVVADLLAGKEQGDWLEQEQRSWLAELDPDGAA
jgi:hypothetical protein